MFICGNCHKQTQPGKKQYKIPISKRVKYYGCGSIGWEIVKEALVCKECFEILEREDNVSII